MFKASFPWAKQSEEQAERQYLKSFPDTSRDEVAGNVWIPEKFGKYNGLVSESMTNGRSALEIAEDYGITPWMLALLDPSEVLVAQADQPVTAPPKFIFTAAEKLAMQPAKPTKGRARKGSPAKQNVPKASSPKKRVTKAVKEANAAAARQASDSLQAVLDTTGASATESVTDVSVKEEKVTVNVLSTTEISKSGVETTHTNVEIKMPPGSPEMPLPESTEEMIAQAKEMVEAAAAMENATQATKKSGKRKADAVEDGETEGVTREIPAKRPKLLEQEVRKQKVRNRALVGVAASLVMGYASERLAFGIVLTLR